MNTTSLINLGWQPFFQQQLTLDELEATSLARITAHHRSEFIVKAENHSFTLPITNALIGLTLGDWILIDGADGYIRRLDRKSFFARKAAGTGRQEQAIAANIDTVFIVCSLNHDFNLNRIERYLALAHEAAVEPVVVLTKADLCDDVDAYRQAVQSLSPLLMVEVLNALDKDACKALLPWCKAGQTLSLLGSSGVGKSTLINSLLGNPIQATGGIREDDSKGRHTTTARSMHQLPLGGVIIDSPGMRELQLTDCESGVAATFADIERLALKCRFSDCQHNNEPGCAIKAAIEQGNLDTRRLHNYRKLLTEQARNRAQLHEARAKDKAFGKMIKNVTSVSRQLKRGQE